MRSPATSPTPSVGVKRAEPPAADTREWERLITMADIATLVGVAGMLPVSWLAPPSFWRRMANLFAPVAGKLAGSTQESVQRIGDLAGDCIPEQTPDRILADTFAAFVEGNLQLLRDYRPGGWNPTIELTGQDRLDEAMSQGRGVILWMSLFVSYSLVAKIAFHRAGYAVSHLSHPKHGYSNTRFARRFLNPIRIAVEMRYIRERVVLSQESSVAALRALQKRLEANEIVSFTVTPMAQQPVKARFLAGELDIAGGAPSLALRSGAALLPVFPVQTGANEFSVEIGPRIEMSRSISRAAAIQGAVDEYARQLEPYVRSHPGQWRGWQTL